MSVSTTIDSTLGVVSTVDPAGTTAAGTVTVSGLKAATTTVSSTPVTLVAGSAGLVLLSTGGAATVTMPDPSTCPGSTFVFRSTTAQAHVLTASLNAKQFTAGLLAPYQSSSHRLTFAATAGNSVAMLSDGNSFLVIGTSGSFTWT